MDEMVKAQYPLAMQLCYKQTSMLQRVTNSQWVPIEG